MFIAACWCSELLVFIWRHQWTCPLSLSVSPAARELSAHGEANRRLFPGLQRHRGLFPGEGSGGETVRPAAQRVEQQVETSGGLQWVQSLPPPQPTTLPWADSVLSLIYCFIQMEAAPVSRIWNIRTRLLLLLLLFRSSVWIPDEGLAVFPVLRRPPRLLARLHLSLPGVGRWRQGQDLAEGLFPQEAVRRLQGGSGHRYGIRTRSEAVGQTTQKGLFPCFFPCFFLSFQESLFQLEVINWLITPPWWI